MLTSLEIENFKCFAQLTVSSLAKVNLIVGASNAGKTSLLEALSLVAKARYAQPDLSYFTRFRPSLEPAAMSALSAWLFNDQARPISKLSASLDTTGSILQTELSVFNGSYSSNAIVVQGAPPIGIRFAPQSPPLTIGCVSTLRLSSSDLARKYDRWTVRAENEDRFVEFLRSLEPRLKTLRPMEHTGQRMLYADVRLHERIALPLLGEGFNRLVQIFGAIIGEDADVLLIDEIENGLHWSGLPQVWAGIRAAVMKEDVQIFATTHSLECIAAAVEIFKGEPKNDLAVHRLERGDDGEIHCVTMGEDELERMLERNWEIR